MKSSNKANILSNLKREVMILRSQLDTLYQKKISPSPYNSKSPYHSKNKSITKRFDTANANTSLTPEKGIRRFAEKQDKFHNIAELIMNKSVDEKAPKESPFRRAEYVRTRENFKTEAVETPLTSRVERNPLTGIGYDEKRRGIKIVNPPSQPLTDRAEGRRHYSTNYYR